MILIKYIIKKITKIFKICKIALRKCVNNNYKIKIPK